MIDYSTGWLALKSGLDALKTAVDIKDQGKIIDIQSKLLELHASALGMQEKIGERDQQIERLRKEIEAHNDWKVQSERYFLKDYGSKTFAWELKSEAANGQPIHSCCPTCFAKKQLAILHCRGTNAFHQEMMVCGTCKSEINLGTSQREHLNSSVRIRGDWMGV